MACGSQRTSMSPAPTPEMCGGTQSERESAEPTTIAQRVGQSAPLESVSSVVGSMILMRHNRRQHRVGTREIRGSENDKASHATIAATCRHRRTPGTTWPEERHFAFSSTSHESPFSARMRFTQDTFVRAPSRLPTREHRKRLQTCRLTATRMSYRRSVSFSL